jgi:hypothetical protein
MAVFGLMSGLVFQATMPIGLCEGADASALFTVDVNQQKANIEKEFAKIDEWLPASKLQDIRSTLELIDHKIDRLRKDLSKDDIASYQTRTDKIKKTVTVKEDSLVTETDKILHSRGPDAALDFMQNDLRAHGMSESKISGVEKKILEEAPAIKQAQEHEAISRTINIFESGKMPDSSVDPYIVKTAELIMKARADSVKRVEDAQKRKEIEAQEKIERARMEKELKEKEKEDALIVKQKEEDEKKRLAEEQIQNKLLAKQEKARKDSIEAEIKIQKKKEELQRESERRIEAARKEREKSAGGVPAVVPQPPKEPAVAKPEKINTDSIEAAKLEKERLAKAEEQRRRDAALQQEKAKKDSIETAKLEKERLAKAEEQRRKDAALQQEKAKKDSIEVAKLEKDRLAKTENQRHKDALLQREQAKKDSLEAAKLEKERLAKTEDQRRKDDLLQREQAKKDSLEAAKLEKERLAKTEDQQRRKDALLQREQAKKDSLEAAKLEKERLAKSEEQRRKDALLQQEKAKKDSIETAKKENDRLAKIEAERQKKALEQKPPKVEPEPIKQVQVAPKVEPKPAIVPVAPAAPVRQAATAPLPAKQAPQEPPSKYAQDYLKKLKDAQKEAQNYVMDLYALLDQKKGKEALDKFKLHREFIGKYVEVQVFNVLEQSIMQMVMETPVETTKDSSAAKGLAPDPEKKASPDQQRIDLINGLIRDNKIETAYIEFKKSEKQLKTVMPKEDFRQLKSMVENSYKTYKANNK